MTSTRPLVGASRPRRILMSVLLPAPLAPTRPTIPGATSRVSSSRATTPGNRLVSASTRISGAGIRGGGLRHRPGWGPWPRSLRGARSPGRARPRLDARGARGAGRVAGSMSVLMPRSMSHTGPVTGARVDTLHLETDRAPARANRPSARVCPRRPAVRAPCATGARSSAVEQGTFNPLVLGSNPSGLTTQRASGGWFRHPGRTARCGCPRRP